MSLFYQGWFAKIIDVQIETIDGEKVILGQGGFGTVFKGKMKIENINNTMETRLVPIAIKRIYIPSNLNKDKQTEYVKRELSVFEQIKSKHIVQFYGKEEKENYYDLYLELCDGNLSDYLTDENGDVLLNEEEALRHFRKIFDALDLLKNSEYQRSRNAQMKSLYHRDIKVQNILFKKCAKGICIKLCDFGISQYESDVNNQKRELTLRVGTSSYMSPENKQNQLYELEKNETWTLGLLLICLLFGMNFLKKNKNVFYSNNNDHLNLINQQKSSNEVKKLLSGLLQKTPENRMNYCQIKDSLVYKLYRNNSQRRSYINKNQFEAITSDFENLGPSILNQIPKDLFLMIYEHYKNQVYKQCNKHSGYYNSTSDKLTPQNLQIQYEFLQNMQLENQNHNYVENSFYFFWRQYIQPNQRFHFFNILEQILEKLQVEKQIFELNKKLVQEDDESRKEKIEQYSKQIGILIQLVPNLKKFFECWNDSQLKQSQKNN